MKVTIDANILFTCLIKDGETRRIWFTKNIELFAPKFVLKEFLKYRKIIYSKFKGSKEDFSNLLENAMAEIKLADDEELVSYLQAVKTLTRDEKDWLYLACALKEDTIIWSNDKEFKKQKRIKIKTTEEMIKEFGKL